MLLQVEGLTKIFGGLTAVNEVSFQLQKGQILGVIGPNGSGKTTLFNLLTGTHKPTRGRIVFEEKSVGGLKPYQMAKTGLVRTFQSTKVFQKVPVVDHVVMGRHCRTKTWVFGGIARTRGMRREEAANRERALEILRFTNLADVRDQLAGNISGTQQRRLMVATALAVEPKLLLLDELTAGMSAEETDEVVDLIKRIRDSGITVLLIEHNMKVAMNICDHIVALSYGEKITEGAPAEVVQDRRVIEAYLGEEYRC